MYISLAHVTLMGIKDYIKFVRTEYSQACKKRWLARYTDLYIDLNHALHNVCYGSRSSDEVLHRLKSYLMEMISTYRPTKRIYIAADGAAPIAKMLLQRKRRYEKVKTLKKADNLDMSQNLALNFTPGTEFMLSLANELKHFKSFIEITYSVKVTLDIETVDEGEIKIRRKLGQDCETYREKHTTIAVYSGDADMILLLFSLNSCDLRNIYQIVNKDTTISMGMFYSIHKEKYCIGLAPEKAKQVEQIIRNDFIFLNLLAGNDYLPKVLYLKLQNIWNAYGALLHHYRNGLVSYNESNKTIEINCMFMVDLICNASGMNKLNYDKKFNIAGNNHKLNRDYVQGLAWCFDMYSTGICADYRYIYNHKGAPHYSALMMEIARNNTRKVNTTFPIDSDLYGILLIPEKADALLSEKQRECTEELLTSHPIIYEEERCQKCSVFSKQMSNYNSEAKALRTPTSSESPLFDLEDDSNDSNDSNDCDDSDDSDEMSDDTRIKLKESILEKIRNTSSRYAKHKETHDVMNINHIESIEQTFRKIGKLN